MIGQKTLLEFKTAYNELKECGYINNHKELILKLLQDGLEHSGDSIALAGGKQYNARILELRREGYDIVAIRQDRFKFNFRLLSLK